MTELEAELRKLQARTLKRPAIPTGRLHASPDAPAPRLAQSAIEHGAQVTQNALAAWECRVKGQPIVDVARGLGLTIEGARELIRQAHSAIREDLKEALELNRQLDLDRVDHLLSTWYPPAVQGDIDAAGVTLKLINARSRLTGTEPRQEPVQTQAPQNLLVWIQNSLPGINRIVDALPAE